MNEQATQRRLRRRMRSSSVTLSVTFLALAAGLAACGSETYTLYCGDEQRYVIEAEKCESDDNDGNDGGGSYFIYYGAWSDKYRPGQQLAANGHKGRVGARDATARGNLNIPPRGGFGGNGVKVNANGSSGG